MCCWDVEGMRNKKGEATREWDGWEGEKRQDKPESEEKEERASENP